MELKDIKGVGEKTLLELNKLNIKTPKELLYFFPKNYIIYELSCDDVFDGNLKTIEVKLTSNPAFIKFKINLNAIIFYASYHNFNLKCVIFSNDYLKYKLFKNKVVTISGKYNIMKKEFYVNKIFFDKFNSFVETDYKESKIPNSTFQRIIKNLLDNSFAVEEKLPKEIIQKYKLYPINEYIIKSHFPTNKEDVRQVIRRRKYEEFFHYAIKLELLKINTKSTKRLPYHINSDILNDFYKNITFELTNDQKNAIKDIINDLNNASCMNRLIQGDVGSGKTIVSMALSYLMCKNNKQVAVMVPTEILANQEYNDFKNLFSKLGYNVELLTSNTKQSDRNNISYRLLHNRINILIGTHSIISENVRFSNLGAVIIDEEHKFGVNQRNKLINKFKNIDVLYLTATPIPRTLGLTSFGDLDISSIKNMPEGRKKAITNIIDFKDIDKLINIINKSLDNNEQVYVVVPKIFESDSSCITINECYDLFSSKLENRKIKILHSKLDKEVKQRVMNDFKNHDIDILISTTVVEVGVNVITATTMVIMNAERYGLAQLHQLRGRVLRGNLQGYCYLVTNDINNKRLNVFKNCNDGFDVSEQDFILRGPGDYFGSLQSGFLNLEYSNFNNDIKIWSCAKEDAKEYCHLYLNANIFENIK